MIIGPATAATVRVYLDRDGGHPTRRSELLLLASYPFTVPNAGGGVQLVTVSTGEQSLRVPFTSNEQTLVVVVALPGMSQG